MSEEQVLLRLLCEVQSRADDTRTIDLRIEEGWTLNAAATGHNIIFVSVGMLHACSDDELKAVLAHELGHLRSNDTVMGIAFFAATLLHRLLLFIRNHLWRPKQLKAWFHQKERWLIFVVAGIVMIVFFSRFIFPVVATIVYFFIIQYIDRFFEWMTDLVSRYAEYRQDLFAYSLGYGPGLVRFLAKAAALEPQVVNWLFITTCSSHPVIYHRIRKLEMLICQ